MSDAPTPPADADTADAPEQAPDATPEPTAATADDLAKWKALARKHEANAKANAAAARRLAEIEDANKSEAERLSARAEAAERERDEARAAMTRAVAESVVTAAAAGRLADPRDALALLDISSLTDDDGKVDAVAVTSAIDGLLASKPYLAPAGQRAPAPDPSQGGRPGGASQLTQSDLQSMTPAQVRAAREEGRLDGLLGIKR